MIYGSMLGTGSQLRAADYQVVNGQKTYYLTFRTSANRIFRFVVQPRADGSFDVLKFDEAIIEPVSPVPPVAPVSPVPPQQTQNFESTQNIASNIKPSVNPAQYGVRLSENEQQNDSKFKLANSRVLLVYSKQYSLRQFVDAYRQISEGSSYYTIIYDGNAGKYEFVTVVTSDDSFDILSVNKLDVN